MALQIREADPRADWPGIWPIFKAAIALGDVFAFYPDTNESAAQKIWFPPAPGETFVAIDREKQRIVGSSYIKPNQPGLGSHVANAGFMVGPEARGLGAGRALAEHAIAHARERGYAAMQFNYVVSTNVHAVELWKKLGFAIVGTLPEAFENQLLGRRVDVYVMHRFL